MDDNDKPSYVERIEAILAAKSIVGGEFQAEGAISDGDDDSDDAEESEDVFGEDEEEDDALTLEDLCSFVSETKITIDSLEDRLHTNATSRREVNMILGDLAKQYGFLEDIQFELDALELTTVQEKAIRRERTDMVEALTTKLSELEDACGVAIKSIAEKEKDRGNEAFKSGNFQNAIEHYSESISIDPSGNAAIYTNRALAYQKANRFSEGLADARSAVKVDCNFLKGYVIASKILLNMDKPLESKENLDIIPTSLQTHAEVLSLRIQTAFSAKECGNAKLKEGKIDDAIRLYSCAIDCDPSNHLLFSNRSAAFQSKKQWREAAVDAQKCVQLCSTFAKGYVHLGRSQVQLKHYDEALSTVASAVKTLDQSELANIQPQLNEITESANTGRSSGPQARSTSSSMSSAARAEALKEKGNECYKDGEYQDAIRFYSQAIAASPNSGSYYGNRAAAWVMLKEFKRAIQDCSDGIDLERTLGEADKLRVRKATAMAGMGKVDAAINFLEEALLVSERKDTSNVPAIEKLLKQLGQAKKNVVLGNASLSKGEFSRAKRLFQMAQSTLTDDPDVRLGIAKSHLGLGEFDDSSREAQKIIGLGSGAACIEAYTIRADALMATGATELASKHLSAALQMDPDNEAIGRKLKQLRRLISETTRIRTEIDTAMNKRNFEEAIAICGQGLCIDKEAKKLMAEMHGRRARAYAALAKLQLRGPHSASPANDDVAAASSPKELSTVSWRRVLQDCNSCLYYEGTSVATILLKCDALQSLEKYEDAVSELESICSSSLGHDDPQVREKLQQAQRLLKKSKRVNLYDILGLPRGELSTDKEISMAYKKMALKWHPDRHSNKSPEERKHAEDQFKKVGDAYELLTDPVRKRFYDEGYDRDEIEQKVEMQKQQQQHGGGSGRGGYPFGGGGHYY